LRESKQGEQPPRGEMAPLKRDRARAAAREKQLNEQKSDSHQTAASNSVPWLQL